MRAARYAALVVATFVVQVAVFPHLRLFGVVPDLGLVLAVAVAYREGPETAAVVGFAAGLLFDLFLETPAGLSALSYALTGYLFGMVQSAMIRTPRGVAPLLGLFGGIVGGLLYAGAGVVAGVDVLIHWQTLPVVAGAAVYDALVAPVIFGAANRLRSDPQRAPARLV